MKSIINFRFKIISLIFYISIFLSTPIFAQLGINTDGANPEASAMLDVVSTDKGVLIPRMTEAQKNAISPAATAEALLIYQIDAPKGFYYFDGSNWQLIRTDGSAHNTLMNGTAISASNLTYLSETSGSHVLLSSTGYSVKLEPFNGDEIAEHLVYYTAAGCTGTAYVSVNSRGEVFEIGQTGGLGYADKSATTTASAAYLSRHRTSITAACEDISGTIDNVVEVSTNAAGTTGISLTANTAYKITFN